MTILVVDDSHVQRVLFASMLRDAGHHSIQMAGSAAEAFVLLGIDGPEQTFPPTVDLILMDIVMHPMDGIEACSRIMGSERTRHIPIVMVSALDDEAKLQAAFAAGAVDYVTKPVRKIELMARVRHVLRLKRETDERNARERDLVLVTGQLQTANLALQELSLHDELTGIANRRRLDEYLAAEWRRALRSRTPVGLIMIDIDYFKRYNDTNGHAAGDDALTRVARSLEGALRRSADLVARCGGEEFAVVLPDTNAVQAAAVAETMRTRVAAMGIEHRASLVSDRVTISAGVASAVPERSSSPTVLSDRADRALYQSKHGGRNRVTQAA